MALVAIGLGVLGAAGGIFGAVSQGNAQNEARARQEAYLKQQFEQDKKSYQFNWEESLRNYEHVKAQIAIQRAQEETIASLKDRMAADEYKYNLAIRDYDYLNSLRQYNESEKRYTNQRYFNNLAAGLAQESEQRRYQEIETSSAFDSQDMLIEMLQSEGMQQARGVAGRSSARATDSVLAAYGRNQAVLAESLVSAKRQSNMNMRDIALQKYGADLSAEANRMLMPTQGPELPAPYKTPRGVFLDPLEPRKGPAPVKGVNTVQGASPLGIVSGIAGSIAGGVSTYTDLRKAFK